MSAITSEQTKLLNLLRQNPAFFLCDDSTSGESRLLSLEVVPDHSGTCWISGTLATAAGDTYDAVHVVSTDDGGELQRTYVWDGVWLAAADLPRHLDLDSSLVFPYAYTLAVPLERDIYRDDPPHHRPDIS